MGVPVRGALFVSGSGNPVLTVALGGRTVGVNTDNPETALHVMGDAIRLQSGGKRIQCACRPSHHALALTSSGPVSAAPTTTPDCRSNNRR